MEKRKLAILAIILAGFLGGLSPIFLKFAFKELDPMTILLVRYFIASLILVPLAYLKHELKFQRKDMFRIIIASMLFAVNIVSFIIGLQYTTIIPSQVLYLLTPAIIVIISYFFLKQKVISNQVISIILGGFGALLLVIRGSNNIQLMNVLGTTQGNAIILLGVVSWSIYIIVTKKLSQKYSALSLLTVNTLVTTIIALFFIFFYRTTMVKINWPLSLATYLSLTGLIFVNSIGFFFLFQWATAYLSPFTVSLSSYLGPFSAAFFGILLLGDKINLTLIISAILIFISSYVTMSRKKV